MRYSAPSPEQRNAAIATMELKDQIEKFIEASHRWERSSKRLTYIIIFVAITQVVIQFI